MMKAIEGKMVAAVRARKAWTGNNTAVVIRDGMIVVYLFGNLIAKFPDDNLTWQWTLAGWNSVTTRSRINALSCAFGGAGVGTRKGQAHIGDVRGPRHYQPIRSNEWVMSPRNSALPIGVIVGELIGRGKVAA